MGVRVRSWLEIAVHHLAGLERHDDHVLGLHAVVRHAGRFDNHQPALAVNPTGIAPRFDDQTFRDEIKISLADLSFKFFEHLNLITQNHFNSSATTDFGGSVVVKPLSANCTSLNGSGFKLSGCSKVLCVVMSAEVSTRPETFFRAAPSSAQLIFAARLGLRLHKVT